MAIFASLFFPFPLNLSGIFCLPSVFLNLLDLENLSLPPSSFTNNPKKSTKQTIPSREYLNSGEYQLLIFAEFARWG